MILGHDTKTNERLRNIARDLGFVCDDIERAKSFIHSYTSLAKTQNWEIILMTTAQGGSALDYAYVGNCFDGRYVYYSISNSRTFLRFDTTQTFQTAAAWEKIAISTAQGGAGADWAYYSPPVFDGRYVYFVPHYSDTFIRFDTTQSFTTAAAWEKIAMSTAQGAAALDDSYLGSAFDGRYVYFVPYAADTFLRFDTTLAFTNSSAWAQINMSTAQGAATLNNAFRGGIFDRRYIYFVPYNSDTFLRFDTTQSFVNSSAWSQMSMSTAQGAAALDAAYTCSCFDDRFVYFVPQSSDTFLRFDTTKSFTNSSAWEKISMSTAQGAAALDGAYSGNCFDGRYIYFVPYNSDTFLRFDTTQSFTNSSAWSQINMSTAQGSATLDAAYFCNCFDGKYVYYSPLNSDVFLRVLACPNRDMRV